MPTAASRSDAWSRRTGRTRWTLPLELQWRCPVVSLGTGGRKNYGLCQYGILQLQLITLPYLQIGQFYTVEKHCLCCKEILLLLGHYTSQYFFLNFRDGH
uniref:Uncharacterized protein n=1 Tax=Setaria viridis TaxID=4556 RepID=A0A4U6W3X9_SETVI|nr:hypothetical protein SEVIR_2G153200v2 [Setaria viridis]